MSDALVSAAPPLRVAWIDRARGIALIAMAVFHFSFDLAMFGVVDWQVGSAPLWRAFAISIAASFIALSGLSLGLAARGGLNVRGFLRRLAILAGAAALVTLGTWAAMPTPITFGILHAIALFSILALPFLRAPSWLLWTVALGVLILPLVHGSEIFSHPLLYPVGLDPTPPPSMDYEPVFPWFAPMLAGLALSRVVSVPLTPMATDPLALAGRHSLLIYLLHQPILIGIVQGLIRAGVL